MKKKLKYAAAAVVVFAAAIYVNNTNLLAAHREGTPVLLAHRGIAQRFDERELKNDTCTAARMLPPSHDYLENTIASMRAGFAAGADIVEFDVHPTTDGEFAVFHDWTLDCRTDGHGVTREHSHGLSEEARHRPWLYRRWRQDLSVSRQGHRPDADARRGAGGLPADSGC